MLSTWPACSCGAVALARPVRALLQRRRRGRAGPRAACRALDMAELVLVLPHGVAWPSWPGVARRTDASGSRVRAQSDSSTRPGRANACAAAVTPGRSGERCRGLLVALVRRHLSFACPRPGPRTGTVTLRRRGRKTSSVIAAYVSLSPPSRCPRLFLIRVGVRGGFRRSEVSGWGVPQPDRRKVSEYCQIRICQVID